MKKILMMMIIMMFITVLTGCSTIVANDDTDYAGKTLTGQISEISGTKLTLHLGKLKKNKETQELTQELPQMSEDFSAQGPMMEKPDNGQDGQMPENETGQMPQDFGGFKPGTNNTEKPQLPKDFNDMKPEMDDTDRPELPQDFNGQMPPQMMEGEGQNKPFMNKENGQMSEGFPGMMKENNKTTYIFKMKDDTAAIDVGQVTVTLADGSIGSVTDLKVGDVVEIAVDENNKVYSLTVYEVSEIVE